MKYLILITYLLIHNLTYGQKVAEEGNAMSISDTTFFRLYTEYLKRHELKLLSESSFKECYRFWTLNHVVEIWDNNGYQGRIISYVYESNYPNEALTNRTYSIQENLDSTSVKNIIAAIEIASIATLPSQYDSIQKWNCPDCTGCIIEAFNNNLYYFNTYTQPDLFRKHYKTAGIVDDLFKSILLNVNAKQQRKKLLKDVPFEAFTFIPGGGLVTTKVLSKKERKQYRKERDNYRDSIGIPNNLKNETNKIIR